jgi:hypothetical protein
MGFLQAGRAVEQNDQGTTLGRSGLGRAHRRQPNQEKCQEPSEEQPGLCNDLVHPFTLFPRPLPGLASVGEGHTASGMIGPGLVSVAPRVCKHPTRNFLSVLTSLSWNLARTDRQAGLPGQVFSSPLRAGGSA